MNDADSAGAARIDTIAGVVHVISGDRGVWDHDGGAWRVDAGRAFTIGEAEGPEPYVFGRVAGVYVADDGHVYVADWHAHETRVFSPSTSRRPDATLGLAAVPCAILRSDIDLDSE